MLNQAVIPEHDHRKKQLIQRLRLRRFARQRIGDLKDSREPQVVAGIISELRVINGTRVTLGLVTLAFAGGLAVYGLLHRSMGLRLEDEAEYNGADLSLHRISATPERETPW